MTRAASLLVILGASLAGAGCGDDAAGGAGDAAVVDGAIDGAIDAPIDAAPTKQIKHVVVIVQENHTFDTYFGRWCTAPAGSAPTCTTGPACCEAAPAADPTGHAPIVLDDAANAAHDPDHSQACELEEMHGGAMDRFAAGASCSDPRNVALAPVGGGVAARYQQLAAAGALADRYFQPLVGSTSANDMYFAVARYQFTDNEFKPDTNGAGCIAPTTPRKIFTGVTTIADLLLAHGNSFAFYAQGYAAMKASFLCPAPPADCPLHLPTTPCDYDPSDVPFEYYDQFRDDEATMKDLDDLAADVAAHRLPDVAFIKHLGYKNEHPGYGTTISQGVDQVMQTLATITNSPYAADTLILLTWDEGGGYFDHVRPPPTNPVDGQPYGTRVPLLALGRFARHGAVSHVVLEHSSIVKFLEWNFLGATGQLGARDVNVDNLGSLLDPTTTAIP